MSSSSEPSRALRDSVPGRTGIRPAGLPAASPAWRTILRALQEYGAYVGDYSGALSLYAENSPAAHP